MVVAYALERWSIELVSIATLVVWLVLFWLGGQAGAAQVRANIYAIFGLLGVVGGATLWLNGLLTAAVLREALFLLPAYVLALLGGAPFVFDPQPSYVIGLLYLALCGSVLAFGAYLTLLGRIGADRAAYATVLFPLVALAISTVVEDYVWTPTAMLGVALVLAGNLLVLLRPRGAAPQAAGD